MRNIRAIGLARSLLWLSVPALVLITLVVLWPIARLLHGSFVEPTPGLQHYSALLHDQVSIPVIIRTLLVSAIVALITLLLGYPYAYVMIKASGRVRALMFVLVLMPFWMSIMARTFAWYILLQDNGVVNRVLGLVGVGPLPLVRNAVGVTIGTTQLLLPFMVLPLYSVMRRIDLRLVSAARGLGAPPRAAFRRVFLPLTVPGIVAGMTLVYILAIGFYITPQILGSPKQALIAQAVGIKVEDLLDFAGAGALSAVLLVVTMVLLAVMARVVPPSAALGGDEGRR